MPIKEELVVREAVVSGQLQQARVGLHTAQAAQARVGILQYTGTCVLVKCIYLSTCSSILHMTSCRMPPTLRMTLLWEVLIKVEQHSHV